MQPPFQQSAASAHIDDLMRAAQCYRLTAVDGPRQSNAVARSFGAVRSALDPVPAGSQAAARVTNFDFPIQYRI
jgi:hypothetical protein